MRRSAASILLLSILTTSVCACTPSVQGSVNPARFSTLTRVVLLPFATPYGAPDALSESFADEMSAHLGGARFQVVDRTAVVNALTHQEIRGADLADPAVATRVGELMQADAVLIGRVVSYHDHALSPELDSSLAVSVRIVDVRTREVVVATSCDDNAPRTFCDEEMSCLRGKVMRAVGDFIVRGSH
jgi:curli biogenesis system outer membrane secretion channel CsgG